MIGDAVFAFGKALAQNETLISELKIQPIECDNYVAAQEPNSNGQAILDSINDVTDISRSFRYRKKFKITYRCKIF